MLQYMRKQFHSYVLQWRYPIFCAARLGDVLELKWQDIMEKGIYIEQNKTGTKQIKEWSPRLRTAIQLARNVSSGTCEYVINTTKGGKVIAKTLNNWWNQANASQQKAGVPFGCNFHDIKAKGISDYEGSSRDKQIFKWTQNRKSGVDLRIQTKITPTLDLPLVVSKVGIYRKFSGKKTWAD